MCAQSCVTLWNPLDYSSPGSSVQWDFSGKNTEMGCYFLFPPTKDLPHSGIKSVSPVSPALQADSLPTEPSRKPKYTSVIRI